MKKTRLIQQFRDKLDYNYEITGTPRIRAEWNWNHTSKLSLPYRNGAYMKLYEMPTAIELTSLPVGARRAYFDSIFETPVKKHFRHSSPSFSNTFNTPNMEYENELGVVIDNNEFFGLEVQFELDINVPGVWTFQGSSDDSYRVYIDGDETALQFYGVRYWNVNYDETITKTFTEAKRVKIRVLMQNSVGDWGLRIGFRRPGESVTTLIDEAISIYPGELGPKENPELFPVLDSDPGVKDWKQWRKYFPADSILEPYRPKSGIRYNMLQTEPDSNVMTPGAPTWGVNEDLYAEARVMLPSQYITTHNDDYTNGLVRGAWVYGDTYALNDIVTWNSKDYICYVAHTSGPDFDFTKFRLIATKPSRYYSLQVTNQKYKYWMSDTISASTMTDGGYALPKAGFTVYYDEPVSTNKISVTFNLGAAPRRMKIEFYGWMQGENTDVIPAAWHTIHSETDLANVNPYNGQIEYWMDENSLWSRHESDRSDYSVKILRLKVTVLSINRKAQRVEILEASCRKELDITDRVVNFSIEKSMEEDDFMKLIGEMSANSGSITLSNYDNAFDLDDSLTDDQKLEQVKMRKTTFTFDLVYDLEGTNYAPRYYPVRLATLHSDDWSRDGEYDFTVNLFDSAKQLMNVTSTEFFDRPGLLHTLIAQIVDCVGFDRYQFDRYDYDSLLHATTLEYFAPKANATVWQTLQEIAKATLCAIFFDEYDTLQVMTKEEITQLDTHNVQVPVSLDDPAIRKIPKADYVLRGQFDSALESPFNTDPDYDVQAIPNIESFDKDYDVQANRAKITYKERSIKTGGDPSAPYDLTDIVWQPEKDVTLRATRMLHPLPATSVYSEPDNPSMYFYISPGDEALLLPYKGRANVNGEIISWNGKEYRYLELLTNSADHLYDPVRGAYAAYVASWNANPNNYGIPPQKIHEVFPKYRTIHEIIYSEEDWKKRIAKAGNGIYLYTNGFTGKFRLTVDTKKKIVTGRGSDRSSYQTDHPVGPKPGWTNVRTVLGDPGVFAGYWPGEQNSSFYVTQNNGKATSLEINRPTNRNDDWFKTQAMMRNAAPGTLLQQWGFRFKFKDSATMGEISLMFNMGTALGGAFGSQVVTTALPAAFNQMYQISFLETQGIVRNVAHEVAAWVQSPDPLYRTWDNAIRGGASRMYTRNYNDPWEERMKGYRFELKRDVWYDVKVDLTRGRGYSTNADMHFFVWINGIPAGGFAAAGPPTQHLFLPRTNYWAIGSRAASKVEIENAYHWTEFAEVYQIDENTRYDLNTGQYASGFLDEGLLNPAQGAGAPYRSDGSKMDGDFFFDDFGSMLHEIKDFDVELDKAPVEGISWFISNEGAKMLEMEYSPNRAKFSIVNTTGTDIIVQGDQSIGENNTINQNMILYGYVLTEGEEAFVERKNTKSIRDRGEVLLDLNAEWINSKFQAEDLADWIVDHFSEPMDVVNVKVFGDASFSPGDKVRVFYKKAQIDRDWLYIISKVEYNYSKDGLETSLTIKRVRNNETDGVIV